MHQPFIFPNGNGITSATQLGESIKRKRQYDGLTQQELAEISGVGMRFLSELENGKATVQLDKVLVVLANLGLKISIGQ